MHPFLQKPKQLLILGLLWSPFCLWVGFLIRTLADTDWNHALTVSVPPMVLQLVVSLSTWYICKITLPRKWNLIRTIWLHTASAVILNGIWIVLIFFYTKILDSFSPDGVYYSLFAETLPLFLAVGGSLYFISIFAHYLLLAVERSRKTEQEILEQKLLTAGAELRALKATVYPHFLFNCLNMLGPLMRSSMDQAQSAVSRLSDFLLYSLRYGKRELVTVADEVEHIRNYLGIEAMRLGDRMMLDWEVDEKALAAPMLPLTLLPLAENAIKHGIAQCLEGGIMVISVNRVKNNIEIGISNSYEEPAYPVKGGGMGLENIRSRLDAFYGGKAGLTTRKNDNENLFKVTLFFPINIERKS